MPRIRIPLEEWIKAGAKNKSNFIPKGQREVNMIFAADVIFIDTEYISGHEPTPKEEAPAVIEPKPEETTVVPKPKKKPKKKSHKKR